MRLLHILEAMGGGTRRHVLDLLPALVQRGHEVTLAVSPPRGCLQAKTFEQDVAFLESRGVRIRCVDMPRNFAGGVAAVRAVAALVRAERPDIIHCHSTVAGAVGRLARLAGLRTPLVYTPHCISFDTGLPRMQRRAGRLLERALAPLTTRYIAVSRAERRAIRRVLHRNSAVVYNGIDFGDFDSVTAQWRADWNLRDEDFVIGCFGRLCAQKNQAALIRAITEIQQAVPEVKVLLVGGGEDWELLEEFVRANGLGKRVVFAGEHAEARGFYALCDMVVQPSRWEGCPYTVLEAMAAGKAVIAHGVGGIPEVLDGAGYAYRESRGVAQAVLTHLAGLLRNSERGHGARGRIEAHFTIQNMVSRTGAVYAELVNAELTP